MKIYTDKIILIPVFFCFETLYLFSQQFQQTITNIHSEKACESSKLVELYKTYYDYSKINPENLDDAEHKLKLIQQKVSEITGVIGKNKWLPQKLHLSYSKQLLKLMCKNVFNDVMYTRYGDGIFEKNEDKLFDCIKRCEPNVDINEIMVGLKNQAINNHWIYDILTLIDITKLNDMTLEKNLYTIYAELDIYNQSIRCSNNKQL